MPTFRISNYGRKLKNQNKLKLEKSINHYVNDMDVFTFVFVKIFPNVLQSRQKNLENSCTQAVEVTLILPTISMS